MSLSNIGTQKKTATANTNMAINQLLDYVATYPDNGILFRSNGMVLAAHVDAGFLNKTKARSSAGEHLFLTEDVATPPLNGAILKKCKDHQTHNGIRSRSLTGVTLP